MKNSIATFALIILNVVVFGWLALQQNSLMMARNIDVLAIIQAGANLNPLTLGGESWRMISSMFLHFGILHLAANMFGLYSLGSVLEPKIGTLRFLLLYFLCGVAANLSSLLFNIYVPSAGASGAIFGVYGFLLGVEIIGNFSDRAKLGSIALNFIIFIAINAYVSSQVSVDRAGHIGGGITGLSLAFLLHVFSFLRQYISLMVILAFLFSLIIILPQGQVEYYRFFQRVVSTENKTSALFRNVKEDYPLKDSLQQIILPQWISLSHDIRHIADLPESVASDTAIMGRYIALRKQETQYRIQLIERESYTYFDSLEIVNSHFDSLPRLKFILNYQLPKAEIQAVDSTELKPPISVEPTKVFYDSHWNEIDDASEAQYYRIGSKDSLGRWQGLVRDYYVSGNVQMKGNYLDGLKDGVFLYYSDRKTYESAGRYEKEMHVGKWERFHWNGSMQSEVFYNQGVFVRNVWDSLGHQQVKNGEGKVVEWYANGKVKEEGSIRKGKREDFWHGYYAEGKPHYEELYDDNRMVRGVSLDEKGRRYTYDESSDFPFPSGGMSSFQAYVKENIKIQVANGKSGVVKILFYVDAQSMLSNFTVLESLCKACDGEAIRLIEDGPIWHPALLHGHTKIKSQAYAEILF